MSPHAATSAPAPVISSATAEYAEVALPLPVRRTFFYRVPEALALALAPGVQVTVPFRGHPRRGVVVALVDHLPASAESAEIKQIAAAHGPPLLDPHLLAFTRWLADYYLGPWGEVLAAALPGGGEGLARSRARRAAAEDPVVPMALPERYVLTAEQRAAASAVEQAVATLRFAPMLLHGVTGSGKTEVYLRGAAAARDGGGQTLVLAPEVALGSQLVREFRRRFGRRVGVLHSYLSVGERRRNWELARRGALDVVVGARSAVFAPLPRLRLIVVDEEHEPAYKQSEQLRYHGRDAAVRRAQMLGIPVVLGSATPALESLANAARRKYARLALPRRVDGRPLPAMRVVDVRRSTGAGVLSAPLRDALAECLARGEQAVLFLNRRGHSRHLQCRACGFVPECPSCDIALTLHVAPPAWRCHYCDHVEPPRAACTRCGETLLRLSGAGTQRVERELAASFPRARVLRLDTDAVRERGGAGDPAAAFGRGEADVLLGTQMVAKGFDFPRVTLVGVLDADVALHLPDFRAAERTFQLLTQVAGRCGRGPQAGRVLVQTCSPEHPAIVAASTYDPRCFAERELAERKETGYPPYTRLAAVLLSGADQAEVERASEAVAAALRSDPAAEGVSVLGPAPQALARLRGRWRWHVLLKGNGSAVRGAAARALEWAESKARPRGVRLGIDVDPIEVL
jgi:primosomal protein N' (replication factor Y) (superfamily II helicase)